jgi:hypothetical protein
MFENEGKKAKAKGENKAKTYMGGFYLEQESARENESLKAIYGMVKTLKPESPITLGNPSEFGSEHLKFTDEAYKVILGLANLINCGALTKADLQNAIKKAKAIEKAQAEALAQAQAPK